MNIKGHDIDVYKIEPIGKVYGWGAKAIVFTEKEKFFLAEVWGKTETEVRLKAEKSFEDFVNKKNIKYKIL